MYCGMPDAPKVMPVHSATRAEVRADIAKLQGAAAAAAVGDNFILGSSNDVVQGKTCYGGYNLTSATWGGIIADKYLASSSGKAYGAHGCDLRSPALSVWPERQSGRPRRAARQYEA